MSASLPRLMGLGGGRVARLSLHELTANFKDCDQHSLELQACLSRLMCLCYCVSLQPTCLAGQGEPGINPLSEPHHFFTRISVTLRLCRRLLSGQHGNDAVAVGVRGWRGQGDFFFFFYSSKD